MKIKHRALSLLLSLAIMLTFMPAMAFAGALPEETEGVEWSITNDETVFFMEGNSQVLQVTTTLDGTGADLSYQWYLGEDNDGMDWNIIPGETGSSFVANSRGFYACAVTSNGETLVIPFSVFKENDNDEEEDDEEETESNFYVVNDGETLYLENGIAEMRCYAIPGEQGTFDYQWYKYVDEDNWQELPGETNYKCLVSDAGLYECVVSFGDVSKSGRYRVRSWKITNGGKRFCFEYGSSAKLTAETDYSGSDEIKYEWYYYDDEKEEYVEIDGANGASCEPGINITGEFRCYITAEGETQSCFYYAEIDTADYINETLYPDAAATYSTPDNRDLTVDFDEDFECNFPRDGDKITLKTETVAEVFTYTDDRFVSESGEILSFDYELDGPDVNIENETLKVHVYSADKEYVHADKKVVRKYDTILPLTVVYKTDIESISFAPANINLNSEDLDPYMNGYGETLPGVYDFYSRNKYPIWGYDDWISSNCYDEGDSITVTYTDGTSRVFNYDLGENAFIYSNGENIAYLYPDLEEGAQCLKAGENEVRIWYKGRCCTIKVTVTASEHEHSWDNGTVTTAPTCTADGVKTYKCSCGEEKNETIAALGHKWGDWTQTMAPTCSAKGAEERVCANDTAHKETREVAINADAHVWDEGKVTTEPTCTANGVKTFTCKNNSSHTKTEVIAAPGHNMTAHAAKAATEAAEGNSAYWSCDKCSKYFSDAEGKTEVAENSWVIPKVKPAEPSEEEKAAEKAIEEAESQKNDAADKAAAAANSTDEKTVSAAEEAAAKAVEAAEAAEAAAEKAQAAAQKALDNATPDQKAAAQLNLDNATNNLAVAKQLKAAANSALATAKRAAANIALSKAAKASEAAAAAGDSAAAEALRKEAAAYAAEAAENAKAADTAAAEANKAAAELDKMAVNEDLKKAAKEAAGTASKAAEAADKSSEDAKASEAKAKEAVDEKAAAEKAAAEEQARQGVYDKKIPKMKAKKPASKKTSITMKWTKLTKKQLKKSKAAKYEIWLCPNTKFAKEDTIEKIVSKSKSSYTFKKLKKNTKYYVKVRAIKYVDGVKHVGKWSTRKTIKTKKK